jgi:hypothetical protein
MPADPFASIYGDLNWDAPRGPRRCEECGLGEPVAGAYPSALVPHRLGTFPFDRARYVMRP